MNEPQNMVNFSRNVVVMRGPGKSEDIMTPRSLQELTRRIGKLSIV